jgi:Cys-rich repeat protein
MRAVRIFGLGGVITALLGILIGCSCEFRDHSYCASDRDCGAGFVCDDYSNECIRPGCTSDKQCGRGRVCTVTYSCEPGCRSTDGCDPGFVCFSGLLDNGPSQCVPGCTSDKDCPEKQVCAQRFLNPNQCVEGCHSNADCSEHFFCPVGPIPSGALPFRDEVVSRCKSGCHDDAECGPSELCSSGVCHTRCEQASACGTGGFCAALGTFGSVRTDGEGLPLACETGERCSCVKAPSSTPLPNPNVTKDGGTDSGRADSGRADSGRADSGDAAGEAAP